MAKLVHQLLMPGLFAITACGGYALPETLAPTLGGSTTVGAPAGDTSDPGGGTGSGSSSTGTTTTTTTTTTGGTGSTTAGSTTVGSTTAGSTTAPPACVSYTWTTGAKMMFQNNCLGCHSAGDPYFDAASQSSVKNNTDIIQPAINSGMMPLGGPLDTATMAKFNAWVTCKEP